MGCYINYEIDFEYTIEWLDEETKISLKNLDCEIMYLREYIVSNGFQRCIVCLHSNYDIEKVLAIIYSIYLSPMNYGKYGEKNKLGWCAISAPISRL
jgi:hypothetical protein